MIYSLKISLIMIKENKNKIELLIEYFLWNARFLVIIPIFILIILFVFIIFEVVIKWLQIFINYNPLTAIWDIISILDFVLLWVIILIFSWWIYELFVDEIKLKDNEKSKAKILIIHNIDELKEKISKVIIIMIVVYLFKQIMTIKVNNVIDILYLSIATVLLAISIAVISFKIKWK